MGKHPYWVGSHRHTHTHINRCMHVYMLTYTQLGLHRLDSLTWKCCMCPLPALHRLIIICMRVDMNGGVHWFEAACSLSTHTAGFQSVRIDVGWSWLKSTCFSRDIFEPFSLEFEQADPTWIRGHPSAETEEIMETYWNTEEIHNDLSWGAGKPNYHCNISAAGVRFGSWEHAEESKILKICLPWLPPSICFSTECTDGIDRDKDWQLRRIHQSNQKRRSLIGHLLWYACNMKCL